MSVVVEMLHKHMKKSDNVFAVVFGRVGSGKSYFGYSLAKQLSIVSGKPFVYTYSLDEVIDISMNKEDVIVVFDEVAYYTSSYADRKEAERLRKVFQTTRVKRISYVLITPFAIEMAKMIRRYADFIFVMRKRGIASMYRVERDYLRGRVYAVKIAHVKNTTTLEPKDIEEMNQKKTQFLEQIKSEILNGGAAQTTTTPPPLLNLF